MTDCCRCLRRCALLIAWAGVMHLTHTTHAGIETADPNATLKLPAAGAGTTITAGDFTLLAWVRPAALPTGEAGVMHIDDGVSLQLLAGGSVRAVLHRSANPSTLTATAHASLVQNKWALLGVAFSAGTGELAVHVRSESTPASSATADIADFSPGPVGPAVHIGATPGIDSMIGIIGLIALRDHAITGSDFDQLWNHARHHGPYSMDNTSSGGSLTGPAGCTWMINHAMTTRPIDGGVGGEATDRAAIVDQPVTLHNVHVFDATAAISPAELRVVRPVLETAGFVHRSPYEHGFFVRTMPELIGSMPPPPHYRNRISPRARQLATEPVGLVRVIATANSRGIQEDDGSLHGTGNFAHGFLWNNLDRTAGVINRPARLDAGPYFGFDAAEHAPYSSGSVTSLHTMDFSRFWTGANRGSSLGPGQGVHLAGGSAFALRCKPQGLIAADQPLLVQTHLLKFPGASTVHWAPNRHHRQGEPGSDEAAPVAVSLDTQTWSHTFTPSAGDSMSTSTRLVLAGNHVANLGIGDACFAGGGALSVIASVSFDAGNGETIIDLEHPFSASPTSGTVLRFGPWQFTTIKHLWPGLSPGDVNDWRGLKLTADPTGGGVVVFSFDAWRPGVNGFIFGTGGWGGMGYQPQIERAFSGSLAAMAAQLNADVWLQMFATQITNVTWMVTYTDQLRSGNDDLEVLWMGDIDHPSVWDNDVWHKYVLDQAANHQVVSTSLLLHPDLGGQLDLLADGIRSDALHISQRGNQRLAAFWTEMIHNAALPGPVPLVLGDLTGDGAVTVGDMLELLTHWGPCDNANDCTGDLNGDGAVNVGDLLILLSNWT